MSAVTSLRTIQFAWVTEAVSRLASQEPIQEGSRDSFNQFFNKLIQSIDSGDPRHLDSILEGWVAARMRTDLDSSSTSIAPVLDQILQLTIEICRQRLTEQDAFDVIVALIPVQSYLFALVSRLETQIQIKRLSTDLELRSNH